MKILNKIDKECGIYQITNTVNGKFYIGSAKNAKERLSGHRSDLKSGKHRNSYLQNVYNEARNLDLFTFHMVIYCDETKLEKLEQIYIDDLNPEYNIVRVVDERWVRTEETKAKIRAANIGKTLSAEHKAKLSAAFKGVPKSAEHSAKVSSALKGKRLSAEHRAKLREAHKGQPAWNKGKLLSAEHKAKLSAAKKGKRLSAEHVEKIRARKKELAALRKSGTTQPLAMVESKTLRNASLGNHTPIGIKL